jgi:hypothetical protein
MKKLMILVIAMVGLAIGCSKHNYQAIRSYEEGDSTYGNRYRLNEIIVVYRSAPTPAMVDEIKASFARKDIDMESLKVTKFNSCKDAYVELWQAKDINSGIHADGVDAGTVSHRNSDGVGEDGLAFYSLNFLSNVPVDTKLDFKSFQYTKNPIDLNGEGKEAITVAVLDTGIDTRLVSPNLLWKNPDETKNGKDDDGNCYDDDINGWNFIGENPTVTDDNQNLHGTLVSHYIINEFARSTTNFVQIMNLKTHGADGSGDLFSSICAIHYAMNNGANIINASWGFYYYQEGPHPYLDLLITETLRDKGILFVTAAGNKIEEVDKFARKAYYKEHGVDFPKKELRNLEYHNFYPACLSLLGQNVITVTTTNGSRVSRTQNYSETYVDIGVMLDEMEGYAMKFKTPFPEPPALLSGSSFATAIACGKIGAYLPKSMYVASLNKNAVFEYLSTATPPPGSLPLIRFEPAMGNWLIRNGKMTYPR